MDLAWFEHILWARLLLISIVENLDDLEQTKTRLLENPKDIANIFQKYYGNNTASIIEKLLTEHLVIGYNLIVALKTGKQKVIDELNKKWYKNADDMVDELNRLNTFYLREELHDMLYNYLKLLTEEAVARLKSDYTKDIKAHEMLQEEVLQMSEFFANGIFKQFPHLF